MQGNNKLSDKFDQLQVPINNLKFSKCAVEENLLPNNQWAQVVENQIKALIIKLAELQWKFKSQLGRVLVLNGC